MHTECSAKQLEFVGDGRRRVVAGFDAGRVSSDGGLLLLREVAERTGMLRRLAPCGSGHRDHTSVATPERRAALISWGLPRQQGSLLTKVNERTAEWE